MPIPDHSWNKDEASIVKMVWDGGADQHAQRRMIKHLVEVICGINQIPLEPGNPDITAFNAGRQWVARQLQNAITIPLDKLIEEPHESRSSRPISAVERAARSTAAGLGQSGRTRR